MRTFKLTVNENELKTLIRYNCGQMHLDCNTDTSSRIHDLTKRLNKSVETDNSNNEDNSTTSVAEEQLASAKSAEISGWG